MPKNFGKSEKHGKYGRGYYATKGYSGNSAHNLYIWFRRNNYEITDFDFSNFCRKAKCERRKTLDDLIKIEDTTETERAKKQCKNWCMVSDYNFLDYLKENNFDIRKVKKKSQKTKVRN